MKEFIISFLKSILHDPLFAIVFLVVMMGGVMWVFILSKLEKTAGLMEKACVCFFLFLACEIWVVPFILLSPRRAITIDRSILAQALQFGFYAIIFYILYPKIRTAWKNRAVVFKDRFLWIVLFFALASTLWSIDPQKTLRTGLMLLVITGFAVVLGVNYSWSEILSFFRLVLTAVLCASMVIRHTTMGVVEESTLPWIIQGPPKGISGVVGHENALGPLMALNIILWFFYMFNKRKHSWLAVLPIILSFTLLVKTNSRGALLTFFITMIPLIWVIFVRRFGYNRALAATILFFWTAGGLSILLISNLELVMSFIGKDVTLTGRIGLWQILWERLIRPHLFFGNGYAAFFQAGKYVGANTRFLVRYIGSFALGHAHNGYIQVLVDLGIVGLILFIVSLFRNIFEGIKYLFHTKEFNRIVPSILLTFFIFTNIAENRILTIGIYWILYVVISVRLSMESIRANVAKIKEAI